MKQYISWIVIIGAVVVILGGIIWYSSGPGQHDALASCVAESGATFYGAFWCPHCQEQKALFGKSAKLLPYTECSTPDGQGQTQICKDKNIESYPTWEFKDGTRHVGVLSLEELASSTSCSAVEPAK